MLAGATPTRPSVRHDILHGMVEAPKTYSKRWDGGDRIDPPYVGNEREILVAYLDWHRATFEAKCTGVPPERLSERTVPPSTLTLHGLVRHLAGAERWWFRIPVTSSRPPSRWSRPAPSCPPVTQCRFGVSWFT
jgi:hypothetical protein